MKLLFCFTILFFYNGSSGVRAQEKNISNLRSILATITSARHKIDVLNDYADTLCLHKSEVGYKLALEALQLSKEENYFIGIGDACNSLGLAKFRRDNDSAIFYFTEAREAYLRQYPGLTKFSFVLNNLSRVFDEQLRFDAALYWARQALHHTECSKEPAGIKNRWLMFSNGAMANAQAGSGRNDSANYYYLTAIALAEQASNNKMLGVYFKALSGIQAQLGNYEKAAVYGRKAIAFIDDDCRALSIALANLGSIYSRLKDFSNADKMADSSIKTGRQCNVFNSIGRNYITLGNSQMALNNYAAALQYFKTGLQEAQLHHNSKSSISSLYNRIGEAYERLDSLAAAKENYLQALKIADGDNEIINAVYLSLSHLSFKEGNTKSAYQYLKQYNDFRDTVYTKEKIKIISELNTRYETAKKDQQLLLLSKDKELQQAALFSQLQQIEKERAVKREQQLVIDNYELETEKQEQLLKIQSLDIENTKIEQQRQQAQLASSKASLEIEKKEKELNAATVKSQRNWFLFLFSAFIVAASIAVLLFNRYKLLKKIQNQQLLIEQRQRISRDLHDEMGATLSGIAMYSHLAKEQMKEETNEGMKNSLNIIQQHAGEMVNKLNDIVWLINPGNDNLQKLLQRLEDYAVQMAAVKGIRVKSNINGHHSKAMLPAETRRNIYLLFKEAINNAVKYSGASQLEFIITEEERGITLVLSDNGSGFDLDTAKAGNGISNMIKRAEEIKAVFSYDPSQGKGTVIKLHLPH